MEGMGEMMKNMGAPPPRRLPLVDGPARPPAREAWDEVQRAHERMKSSTDLLARGAGPACQGRARRLDHAAMQEAVAVREGLARFDGGLAAPERSPKADPRALAMQWFRVR